MAITVYNKRSNWDDINNAITRAMQWMMMYQRIQGTASEAERKKYAEIWSDIKELGEAEAKKKYGETSISKASRAYGVEPGVPLTPAMGEANVPMSTINVPQQQGFMGRIMGALSGQPTPTTMRGTKPLSAPQQMNLAMQQQLAQPGMAQKLVAQKTGQIEAPKDIVARKARQEFETKQAENLEAKQQHFRDLAYQRQLTMERNRNIMALTSDYAKNYQAQDPADPTGWRSMSPAEASMAAQKTIDEGIAPDWIRVKPESQGIANKIKLWKEWQKDKRYTGKSFAQYLEWEAGQTAISRRPEYTIPQQVDDIRQRTQQLIRQAQMEYGVTVTPLGDWIIPPENKKNFMKKVSRIEGAQRKALGLVPGKPQTIFSPFDELEVEARREKMSSGAKLELENYLKTKGATKQELMDEYKDPERAKKLKDAGIGAEDYVDIVDRVGKDSPVGPKWTIKDLWDIIKPKSRKEWRQIFPY